MALTSVARGAARSAAFALTLLGLFWAFSHVEAMAHRAAALGLALVVAFLARERAAVRPLDLALAAAAVLCLLPALLDGGMAWRAAVPNALDLVAGSVAVLLVLEAARRSCGLPLAATAAAFLLYAWTGPLLDLVGLSPIAHRGYDLPRLVGTLYMTLEGLFGLPLDVAATYILLFTLYGAVLERTGAGEFFLHFALSAFGKAGAAGPARTVGAAGFLLGTVSGSGVATTLTTGTLTWPLLRRSGYTPEAAAALLAASGIGALLSPPTLGAAAFLIAEYLGISYAQVLLMALVPSLLYYVGALVTVEAEAARLGVRPIEAQAPPLGRLLLTRGHHFASLAVMIALLATGASAFRAVLWAIAAAAVSGALDRARAHLPRELLRAIRDTGIAVTPIVVTCATAGIVVGVLGLTGLGLKLSGVLVALGGETRLGTALLAALAVGVLGLAVPVTASYLIAAVMVAPALQAVGVPAPAAHMFVFYYAVLSEVTPPTALAPFAAAALTGGSPGRTVALTWRYTLTAFLVPLAFVWGPDGAGLLLLGPPATAARTIVTAGLGVAALAAGLAGGGRSRLDAVSRAAAAVGGALLLVPEGAADAAGAAVLGAAALRHRMAKRAPR